MLPEALAAGQAVSGFLPVLARVAGVFLAVPVPGFRSMADPARILFVIAITVSLSPMWSASRPAGMGIMAVVLLTELAFGLAVGLALSLAAEALTMGAQALALQAGFAYASTIDPSSQADSPVLQVLAQLLAGLLFFTAGLDHVMLRALARSLQAFPPGAGAMHVQWADTAVRAFASVFELGLRLALPVIGTLLLADLCLALASRVQAQLQLLSLAFPMKMLMALAALSAAMPLAAWVFRSCASQAISALRAMGLM